MHTSSYAPYRAEILQSIRVKEREVGASVFHRNNLIAAGKRSEYAAAIRDVEFTQCERKANGEAAGSG